MGYFAPTFLAFVLNSCGVYIFHETSKPGCEPLVSCLIFLFAVFLLLWDIRLFPSSLRKLWRSGSYFFQFFISAFLMEHIMNDFWFPLDASMATFLPKIAEFEEEVLKQTGVLQFLKSEMAHVLASYTLSLFFLFSVLHATRVVDFRLLRCGFREFFCDITSRTASATRRMKRLLFKPRSVKFQLKSSRSSHRNSRECPLKNYLMEDPSQDMCCGGRGPRRIRF